MFPPEYIDFDNVFAQNLALMVPGQRYFWCPRRAGIPKRYIPSTGFYTGGYSYTPKKIVHVFIGTRAKDDSKLLEALDYVSSI